MSEFPFQKPDMDIKLTEATLYPTLWGKYSHKAKASAEKDYDDRDSHLQNQPLCPSTIDVDFLSNLRIRIRIHCKNANAPGVPVR